MKIRCSLLVILWISGYALAVDETAGYPSQSPPALIQRTRHNFQPQDTMERRNFNVKTAGLDVNDLDASALDDDGKTFTYSYLNYNGSPYLSFLRNTNVNVGYNSTQVGLVSLLGNAALALGGLFVLGKTKLAVGSRPVIRYRPRPSIPKTKFKKKRGQFTFRKKKLPRRRPMNKYLSRQSPVPVTHGAPVLEPVRPLMLDENVGYDQNYDDDRLYDDDEDAGLVNIETNNLSQRKGPYDYQTKKRPNLPAAPPMAYGKPPPQKYRPTIMVEPRPTISEGRRLKPNWKVTPTPQQDFDAYVDDMMTMERPVTAEKNADNNYQDNYSTISLSPDGKRLRRKTRKQTTTTTQEPTETSPSFESSSLPTPSSTVPVIGSSTTSAPPEPTSPIVKDVPPFSGESQPSKFSGFGKDEFDNYWNGNIDNKAPSFMDDFGPQSFNRFRGRQNPEAPKRIEIEERFPTAKIEPERIQRKKDVGDEQSKRTLFGAPEKFGPFTNIGKDFDVDNDELIATISKAFDEFSDFKKIQS